MEQTDLDLLQLVPAHHMQAVVKARHIPLAPRMQNGDSSSAATSTGNLHEIASHLFDLPSITQLLSEVSEMEQVTLRELVSCGGRANSRDLALYLSLSGLSEIAKGTESPINEPLGLLSEPQSVRGVLPGQPPQYPPAHPHGLFEQAVRHLLGLGLLFWGRQTNFAGRDYTSGMHDGVLIVPRVVREAVSTVWDLDAGTLLRTEGDAEVGEGARQLQRTLYLYWSFVATQREGLPLVNNGLLARSALRSIVEHVGVEQNGQKIHAEQLRLETDMPFLLFLRQLLIKLGLLYERKGALYAGEAESFFALPLLERVRRCYRLYQEQGFWNEMAFLPEVNVRPGPGPLEPAHEEVLRGRQVVLERLLHEQSGSWSDIAAFIARTKLYAPYLLFPRQFGPRAERYSSGSNPYGWDFRLRRGWLTHREGWHMVEGGFIRTLLTGPLHWLGLVELERELGATRFRLSSTLLTIVGEGSVSESEQSWGRLIVQPNFELVALAPVSELLLVKLDHFADRVSLEHIAQYRLTRASVTRAIQKGLHAETLQQVLEQAAGGEIPQNVRYSLGEWERQARRIELWQGATLLEVADEELLNQLFADEETHALLGRRLTPTLVEVMPQQLQRLQQILWQRDFLPAQTAAPGSGEDDEGERATGTLYEPQWHLHEDGLLEPFYPVLNLYHVAEAERFCVCDPQRNWLRVTPASVSKALKEGIELEYMLKFLQRFCENGVPGSLAIRMKLWGSGYGSVARIEVERTPLLRLSAQILQDIQVDEELRLLLGSEVEHESRLIRVEHEKLERVLVLLRERGFNID